MPNFLKSERSLSPDTLPRYMIPLIPYPMSRFSEFELSEDLRQRSVNHPYVCLSGIINISFSENFAYV